MKKNEDFDGIIKSDVTLFEIVEYLQQNGPSGVTEIASELGNSKSSVHKHLKTLALMEYVHNDDGVYRLGFRFLEHGGYVRDTTRCYSQGRKAVMDLWNETGEVVLLTVKEFDRGLFLFRSSDPYGLVPSTPIGQRFYLHQNAAGKAMLARLDEQERHELLERNGMPAATERTITEEEQLEAELVDIREQGYAVNFGEKSSAVWAISASFHDSVTGQLGAISITVPESVTSRRRLHEEYSSLLIDAVSSLELRLRQPTDLLQ